MIVHSFISRISSNLFLSNYISSFFTRINKKFNLKSFYKQNSYQGIIIIIFIKIKLPNKYFSLSFKISNFNHFEKNYKNFFFRNISTKLTYISINEQKFICFVLLLNFLKMPWILKALTGLLLNNIDLCHDYIIRLPIFPHF